MRSRTVVEQINYEFSIVIAACNLKERITHINVENDPILQIDVNDFIVSQFLNSDYSPFQFYCALLCVNPGDFKDLFARLKQAAAYFAKHSKCPPANYFGQDQQDNANPQSRYAIFLKKPVEVDLSDVKFDGDTNQSQVSLTARGYETMFSDYIVILSACCYKLNKGMTPPKFFDFYQELQSKDMFLLDLMHRMRLSFSLDYLPSQLAARLLTASNTNKKEILIICNILLNALKILDLELRFPFRGDFLADEAMSTKLIEFPLLDSEAVHSIYSILVRIFRKLECNPFVLLPAATNVNGNQHDTDIVVSDAAEFRAS